MIAKLELYMTGRKVLIKTFQAAGGYCVAVKRQYRLEFSICVGLSTNTIYQIVKQFEGTRIVCDKRAKGRKRSSLVRTEDVGAAWEAVTRNQR
jgi:hypothetical protein